MSIFYWKWTVHLLSFPDVYLIEADKHLKKANEIKLYKKLYFRIEKENKFFVLS